VKNQFKNKKTIWQSFSKVMFIMTSPMIDWKILVGLNVLYTMTVEYRIVFATRQKIVVIFLFNK